MEGSCNFGVTGPASVPGKCLLTFLSMQEFFVALTGYVYDRNEIYKDLRASISPDEWTLIPEGVYSYYTEQANKNIISWYGHALKQCV